MYKHYFVDVQSVVMYGLFLFVMHEVVERLPDGRSFLHHVVRHGAYMVISLQFVDGVTVRCFVVGAVLTVEAWENELLRVAARFNASFSSVPHVSSLVVEEEGRLAECLRRDVCGESSHREPCGQCIRAGSGLQIQPESFCSA